MKIRAGLVWCLIIASLLTEHEHGERMHRVGENDDVFVLHSLKAYINHNNNFLDALDTFEKMHLFLVILIMLSCHVTVCVSVTEY